MTTRVISANDWLSYLTASSSGVRVELASDEFGRRVVADDVPLLAIMPELKGSEACAVDIEVGNQHGESTESLTHSVICTSKLEVQADEQDNPTRIDVVGEDPGIHAKVTTVIRFL